MPRQKRKLRIVVIGGANLDLRGRPQGQYVHRTSNPGMVRRWPGGAARNLAENLARLGCKVWLLSAVGDDEPGRFLLEVTAAVGVDTSWLLVAKGRATGSYLAILDEYGNLMSAISDMEVLEEVTPQYLNRNIPIIQGADLILFDANLPLAAMERIVEIGKSQRIPLAAVTVSIPKALRLLPHLAALEYLFCAKGEAEVLLHSRPISDKIDTTQAAKDLVVQGVGTVVITRGGRGLAYATREEAGHLPAWPVQIVDSSGAGDALAAATLFGLLSGEPLRVSLQWGLAAAALTVQSEGTVSSEISPSKLRSMVAGHPLKERR